MPYHRIWVFVLLAVSGVAGAGRIADFFGDGVLQTHWGSTAQSVSSLHPGGTWRSYGPMKVYSVKDSRAVFGVQRPEGAFIKFGFNTNGELNSVTVEYASGIRHYAEVYSAVTEALGQPLQGEQDKVAVTADLIGASGVRWAEESGINVNLSALTIGFKTITCLVISKAASDAPKLKSDLGLN